MLRSARGELDETVPLASACIERAEETGATACAVVSAWVLGDVLHRRGSYREAHDALELGLGLSSGISGGSFGPTLQATLRANAATMGDAGAAEGGWDEPLASARASSNHLGEASILWKRAETRASGERWDEAIADYADAAAIFEEQGARPNLARVLRAWGAASLRAGRAGEAQATLQRSLELFEEMGLEREAGEVRMELAAAAA